jgi:RES domain-containing protein
MIYTASNPSLAVLEVLAHFGERDVLPDDTVLVTYEMSGRKGILRPRGHALPIGWDRPGPPYSTGSQAYGAAFIASNAAMLRVPSVLVPGQWNYLLNPRRIADRVRILRIDPFVFDARYIKLLDRPPASSWT